jgi:hypothetical protein
MALLAAGFLVFLACAPPVGNGEAGNFRLILSGGGRALSPETLSGISYTVDFFGPGGARLSRNAGPGTASISLYLSLGSWTVELKAYTPEGILYGTGETTITVEAGRTNEAVITIRFIPTWHVSELGDDGVGTGSEAAPFKTVDAALAAIKTAYAAENNDWPGYRSADPERPPTPARIMIRGTIYVGGTADGLVVISDSGLYNTYPPIILGGDSSGENSLDANFAKTVLSISNAHVILEPGLTLTGGLGGEDPGTNDPIGGGVHVADGGTFTMNGGTIEDNYTASYGSGVTVYGTFTMNGGTIVDSYAEYGGGVYVYGGSFTMNGGSISGNHISNSYMDFAPLGRHC